MQQQNGLPDQLSAELTIGNERVKLQVQFSSALLKAHEILPLLQLLTDKIVEAGVKEVEVKGETISCKKGCSVCCSQLVPITEPEAIYLLEFIKTFPKERRFRVLRRYEEIFKKLDNRELLKKIHNVAVGGDREERRRIGIEYFNLGLSCPFLEDHCCSIHEHRPLSCREFLVVSPPEYCAENDLKKIAVVKYPLRASTVLYRFGDGRGDQDARVIPLSLLIDWGKRHSIDSYPEFPAVAYFENFLKRLS